MWEKINFRPIQPEDESFLCELYASTRRDELASVDWDETQKESFLRQQFEAQHTFYSQHFDGAHFDVILLGDKPIGRLYVDRRDDEIRLIDIALLPEHRNSGIGSFLMRDLLSEAEKRGQPVRIHVEKFNPALRLYHRLGFEQIEDQGVYWLLEWRPV